MNLTEFLNKHFHGVKHSMDTTSNISCAFRVRALAIAIACISSASFATQGVDYIPPARYQTMDKYNVNMSGGQVSPTVETVSIGGELGLKHSITLMGNYFDRSHSNNGYLDKYAGGLKFTHLGTVKVPGYPDVPAGAGDATVMRASFLGQHADFLVIRNNGTYIYGAYDGTDYHYEALGDKRHTLERRTDGLVWTQPDGTEVFLSTADMTNTASAQFNWDVKKIVYPNSFTIEMAGIGVITNTGFALKYDFDAVKSSMDPEKEGVYFPDGSNVPFNYYSSFVPANPKAVYAINTAVESCDITKDASCLFVNKWPKATFTWPGGMPRAIYIGRSTFSVTNAAGGKTDFIYEAQDAGRDSGGSIPNNEYYKPGLLISPRLVEVKSAGANASSVIYTYTNEKPTAVDAVSGPAHSVTPKYDERLLPGILTSATGILGKQGYYTYDLQGYYGKGYSSSDIIALQYTTSPVGIFDRITDNKSDRVIQFQLDYRNFVATETFGKAPQKVYEYDGRGNLSKITQGTVISQAGYPGDCTNRKTCNKPMWVIDPNGNQTDYTYHPESGQTQTVTSSADKRGVRAQTRYEYEQFQASYFNATGVSIVGSPIWLKTAEKSCTNSNYTGSLSGGKFSSGCADGKEVVTRYEYKSKNRLMTAQIVEGDGKQYRTCFQYDIYGNQIGKTEPKAGLAACPQEWSGN